MEEEGEAQVGPAAALVWVDRRSDLARYGKCQAVLKKNLHASPPFYQPFSSTPFSRYSIFYFIPMLESPIAPGSPCRSPIRATYLAWRESFIRTSNASSKTSSPSKSLLILPPSVSLFPIIPSPRERWIPLLPFLPQSSLIYQAKMSS